MQCVYRLMNLTGCSQDRHAKTSAGPMLDDLLSWIDSQSLRPELKQLFNTSLQACGLNNNRSNKGVV